MTHDGPAPLSLSPYLSSIGRPNGAESLDDLFIARGPPVPRRACTLTSGARTSITRPERMPPATSIARHSRVHSSTIVRHVSVCRFAQVSNTKSYAHTWFRAVGGRGRGRPVATRRRGRRRGTCSPA